jgi:hypothetical protein
MSSPREHNFNSHYQFSFVMDQIATPHSLHALSRQTGVAEFTIRESVFLEKEKIWESLP